MLGAYGHRSLSVYLMMGALGHMAPVQISQELQTKGILLAQLPGGAGDHRLAMQVVWPSPSKTLAPQPSERAWVAMLCACCRAWMPVLRLSLTLWDGTLGTSTFGPLLVASPCVLSLRWL